MSITKQMMFDAMSDTELNRMNKEIARLRQLLEQFSHRGGWPEIEQRLAWTLEERRSYKRAKKAAATRLVIEVEE